MATINGIGMSCIKNMLIGVLEDIKEKFIIKEINIEKFSIISGL